MYGWNRWNTIPAQKVESTVFKSLDVSRVESSKLIDFAALDHQPVYSVVVLLSPENQPQQHLQAMNIVFSNLQKDIFRRFLRQVPTREALLDLLDEADQGK